MPGLCNQHKATPLFYPVFVVVSHLSSVHHAQALSRSFPRFVVSFLVPTLLSGSSISQCNLHISRASQVALVVKNLPASAGDTDTGSIHGQEDSPGGRYGNPLLYSCLENPWTEELGRLQSIGLQRVGHD